MDLRVMRNFLKIAETENITEASRELHVAQPHLTRQLQALEDELGVTLFTREKKRLHITDEGHFLKQQAEQILDLVNKTERQIQEMHSEIDGTLFVGAIETLVINRIPKLLSAFTKKYPEAKYNIWSSNSREVAERVENGLIDIAFVREPFDKEKFEYKKLFEENWVAFFGMEHVLSQKSSDTITLRELSREELLVPEQRASEIRKWFVEKNLTANIKCLFTPLTNGIELLKQNLGVAILPESAGKSVDSNQIMKKMLKEEKKSTIYVIWKKNVTLPLVAKKFLELALAQDEE